MSEHYNDGKIRLLHGDSTEQVATLDAGSVQTVVTSPPYFGLRDYGAEGQYGAEATVGEYVDRLVVLFREVRRALADDGTVWLNLGDSYAANWASSRARGGGGFKGEDEAPRTRITRTPGFAPKNLLGIPWRVALALQDDGWVLRSDIIWHKPNPMPESVTDRPTRSHEYVFLLAKASRYFYDAEAIKESATAESVARMARGRNESYVSPGQSPQTIAQPRESRPQFLSGGTVNKRTVWTVPTAAFAGAHFATFPPALVRPCILAGTRPGDVVLDPFSGSGTTGMVALEQGRRYVGVDLNADYLDLSLRERFAEPPLDIFGGTA